MPVLFKAVVSDLRMLLGSLSVIVYFRLALFVTFMRNLNKLFYDLEFAVVKPIEKCI